MLKKSKAKNTAAEKNAISPDFQAWQYKWKVANRSDNVEVRPVNLSPIGAKDKYASVLHNVFSEQECQQLIQWSEGSGYEPALVNMGRGRQKAIFDYRKSDRAIIDTPEFGDLLWNRIQDHIPDDLLDDWSKTGLNERMRFLKYNPGDYFKPHYDGSYSRPDGSESSKVTLMLYLNGGFEGGETSFLHPLDVELKIGVKPQTGMVLLFQHDTYHEGSLLVQGQKYAMRTDVMYKRR